MEQWIAAQWRRRRRQLRQIDPLAGQTQYARFEWHLRIAGPMRFALNHLLKSFAHINEFRSPITQTEPVAGSDAEISATAEWARNTPKKYESLEKSREKKIWQKNSLDKSRGELHYIISTCNE